MADYRNPQMTASAGVRSAEIDKGLRAHMNKVYGLMSTGMFVTGIIAYFVGNNDAMLAAIFGSALRWVVIFAPLAVVFGLSAGINRLSESAARGIFYVFSALMGLSISSIFAVYTGISIANTFFTTAVAFAAAAIAGAGMAPEEVEKVFKPFYRAGRRRAAAPRLAPRRTVRLRRR